MCKEDIRIGRSTKSNVKQVTTVLAQTVKVFGTRRDRIALFVTLDTAMMNANAGVRVGNSAQVGTDGFAWVGSVYPAPELTISIFGELILGDIYLTPFQLGGVATVTELYLTKPLTEVDDQ